ncbi:hypothetical protein ACEWY4_024547 [Coilia grayii]|uniref:PiggyBac transposable element-derived protein domain-containing protein n=1 Tax=Coilia grayii TaxID=363190 RepID=A0ABD1J1L7_9TELE
MLSPEMRWIRDGKLLYVKWMDTREVTMCSTIHRAYDGEVVHRNVRSDGVWSRRVISVPTPVKEYNKYMGGVDFSDALIKFYSVDRKTTRWYMKHFLDITVVNSFIIHKIALGNGQKPLTQKAFRVHLVKQLAAIGREQSVERPLEQPSSSSTAASATCFPIPVCKLSESPTLKCTKGRRKCVHCQRCTIFKCGSCDVPLCIVADRICFTEWHKDRATPPRCASVR